MLMILKLLTCICKQQEERNIQIYIISCGVTRDKKMFEHLTMSIVDVNSLLSSSLDGILKIFKVKC